MLVSYKQICYQQENSNDITYWKVLVDAAEQFFNRMINELEQVSINRILEAFVSGTIPNTWTNLLSDQRYYNHAARLPFNPI